MTSTHDWKGRLELLDVKLEGLFQDAVRQCLRFITKEQTEQEMKAELASLNTQALKIIKAHFRTEIEAARAEGAAAERESVRKLISATAKYWHLQWEGISDSEEALRRKTFNTEISGYINSVLHDLVHRLTPTKDKGEDVSSNNTV